MAKMADEVRREALATLVEVLMAQPYPLQVGTFLELTTVAPEVLPTSNIEHLFVRACYSQLLERLDADRQADAHSRCVISGTPGIGKSAFLVVLLHAFLHRSLRVAWQTQDCGDTVWLLSSNGNADPSVDSVDKSLLSGEMADVYLTDTKSPAVLFGGFIVVATSPEGAPSHLKKDGCTYYMPVWPEEEIMAVARHVGREEATVRDNFSKWGGISRYVFMSSERAEHAMDEALAKATSNRNLKETLRALGQAVSSGDVVDRLCHIIPGDDFRLGKRQIASTFVLDRLVAMQEMQLRGSQMQLILELDNNVSASFRGQLFERVCHRIFSSRQSHSFQLRPLVGTTFATKLQTSLSRTKFEWPASVMPVRFTEDVATLQIEHNKYYYPGKSNLAAVDAFYMCKDMFGVRGSLLVLFQDTVSLHHAVKAKGLKTVIKRAEDCANVHGAALTTWLVFRVPSGNDVFASMRQQKYTGADVTDEQAKSDGVEDLKCVPSEVQRIHQYVLCVDMTPR